MAYDVPTREIVDHLRRGESFQVARWLSGDFPRWAVLAQQYGFVFVRAGTLWCPHWQRMTPENHTFARLQ